MNGERKMKKIIMTCMLVVSLMVEFSNFGQCAQLKYMGTFESENYLAITAHNGNVGQKKFVLDVTSVSMKKTKYNGVRVTKITGIIYSRRGIEELDSVPLLMEMWLCSDENGSHNAQFFYINSNLKHPSPIVPINDQAILFTARNILATNTLYNMLVAGFNNKNY